MKNTGVFLFSIVPSAKLMARETTIEIKTIAKLSELKAVCQE